MATDYFACPHCGCTYQLARGNSIPELEWSTGYCEGQFFTDGFSLSSDYQLFTKCESCKAFFWREEAVVKERGGILPSLDFMLKAARSEKNPVGERSQRPSSFFERDHQELLKGRLSPDNELYVRKKIWWEFNHEFRSRGFVESYPEMKTKVLTSLKARLEYFVRKLSMMPVSVPYKYGRLTREEGADSKWALNAWLSFMCDKVYITLDEEYEGGDEYDSRDYYPGKPTVNDLLFYERMRKKWERGEAAMQRKNLEAMLPLLNAESNAQGLTQAEVYRCLGKFDEGMLLLKQLPPSPVASRIKVAVQAKDQRVILDTFKQYG